MNSNIDLPNENKEGQPHRVKVYALFQSFTDISRKNDNVSNEISIPVNRGADYKVYTFDKVFYNDDFKPDLHDLILKSSLHDVNMGFNYFLVMCRLPTSVSASSVETRPPDLKNDSFNILTSNMLRNLLSSIKNEENLDSSLHLSYFQIHENKVIDFFKGSELKDLKVFEIVDEHNSLQIPDLIEKPLVSEEDIDELFANSTFSSPGCFSISYPSILSATLIQKNINSDGFEYMKIGKINVVDFTKCRSTVPFAEPLESSSTASNKHVYAEYSNFLPFSCSDNLSKFLKPAFGGNAKTTVLVSLSTVQDLADSDLVALQWVSQAQKIVNYPSVNERLIVPNSLKDYSEEIHELQKVHSAICEGRGVLLENLVYRSKKNRLAVENEKLKDFNKLFLSWSESVNVKRKDLATLDGDFKFSKSEIKMEEMCSADLRLELEKLKCANNSRKRLLSTKIEEFLAVKNEKHACAVATKKLKSELEKLQQSYCESMISLENSKECMLRISKHMGAERMQMKDKLSLLANGMKAILSDFYVMQKDMSIKLNSLSDFDALLRTWKHYTEDFLSRFSSLINEQHRNFDLIKLKLSSTLLPLDRFREDVLNIIKNEKSEGWGVLSYYLNKFQTFSDSSLKTLMEMMCQIDTIDNQNKSEVMSLKTTLYSLGEGFKQFVSDINLSLKLSQQHFQAQDYELGQLEDMVSSHHEFKKNFDSNIENIKDSILTLKQMCSSHTSNSLKKWSEIREGCPKSPQKYANIDKIRQDSHLIHKEMAKYCRNFSHLHSTVLENSVVIEDTENVEYRVNHLLETHKAIKLILNNGFEANKKIRHQERQKVVSFSGSQKLEVARDFEVCSLDIRTTSQSFKDELRNLQHRISSNNENLAMNMDILLSSIENLVSVYNNCVLTSGCAAKQCKEAIENMPTPSCLRGTLPSLDLSIDESKFKTSTPNILEKNTLNLSLEREKLLSHIKAIVEKQSSQKYVHSNSDSEVKEKNHNASTGSLPNLSSHVIVSNCTQKKFKVHKK